MKKYIAECLGTCILTLSVLFSLTHTLPVPTPVIAAVTLGIFVYTIGSISGAHLNPAVTIGLWSLGKIPLDESIKYILAQLLGANIALLVGRALVTPKMLTVFNTPQTGFAELLGTFILGFGVASVVHGKTPADSSGIVIGGSLLLGILLAAGYSNGVLNPAVALGIGSFSYLYFLAPIIGAVLGMQVYRYLCTGVKKR